MATLRIEIPEKLGFLFRPARYKGARGGRGSGKSWSFARALLAIGVSRKIRVLCAREIQKSIKDSVHKLLKDQIEKMGLEQHYEVLRDEIRGRNGTEFAFTGLSEHTMDSLKSFEGCDICWVEEAHSVSKRSWDILIPTIRKDGSEIWFTYNPDLETDEVHHRFVTNQPDDCICVEMNWRDNPWFNDVLNSERLRCKQYQPDDYDNIWEGKCRPAVEGAIYYKEMEQVQAQGRICNVPYDPLLKAHVVFDLGWNDRTTITIVQRQSSEIRIIGYISGSHKTLDYYSSVLKERRYNWGRLWLPHDGYSGDIKTGKSCAQIMRKLGWDVPEREEITELSVENGIRTTRLTFPRLYFDRQQCQEEHEHTDLPLVECLKRYRRVISRATDEAGAPLHDKYSHGADVTRYTCINADNMRNEEQRTQTYHNAPSYQPYDAVIGM